jgi:hypothetical protein
MAFPLDHSAMADVRSGVQTAAVKPAKSVSYDKFPVLSRWSCGAFFKL